MTTPCEHFSEIRPVEPRTDGCEECLALGVKWTQLRICLSCGHVGCCEDSRHAHALQHFNTTGHPMISSLERGEAWGWCYIDRRYFEPMPGPLPKRAAGIRAIWRRVLRRRAFRPVRDQARK
jgi:monovalent cation:H+ antiporter-2, CPA2 family